MGSRLSAKSEPVNGVMRWEFDNISELNPLAVTTINSPESIIGGLTWKLVTSAEHSERTGQVPHLGLFLHCGYPASSKFWSCKIRSTVRLINRNDDAQTITGKIDVTFYPDSGALGLGVCKLAELNKVLDPTEGFILNDTIIAEADITITKTYGVGISRSINEFSAPDETTDVCLIVEDKKIHVAKAILAAHSPAFKAMFYGKFEERKKTEIAIKDVKHTDFVELLNVVHSSLYEICDESVERILVLADRFQVKLVLEACEVFLLLHSKLNMAQKLLLTDAYKLHDAQAQLIYSIKTAAELTAIKTDAACDKYSDELNTKILDRMFELA